MTAIPTNTRVAKTETFQARTTLKIKETIEHAASLLGLSRTDFLISTTHEKAVEVINNHQILELSQRDSERFIDALNSTPEPSEAFKKAAARYSTMIKR